MADVGAAIRARAAAQRAAKAEAITTIGGSTGITTGSTMERAWAFGVPCA